MLVFGCDIDKDEIDQVIWEDMMEEIKMTKEDFSFYFLAPLFVDANNEPIYDFFSAPSE